jgi:hypothetical protein
VCSDVSVAPCGSTAPCGDAWEHAGERAGGRFDRLNDRLLSADKDAAVAEPFGYAQGPPIEAWAVSPPSTDSGTGSTTVRCVLTKPQEFNHKYTNYTRFLNLTNNFFSFLSSTH